MNRVDIVKDDLSQELLEYLIEYKPLTAMDVETDGFDWRGRIGAISIYAEGYGTEIVHLPNRSLYNLRQVCIDPMIKKVFHHAPFDMRFLMHYAGVRFNNVECTRIAGLTLDPTRQYKHTLIAMLKQYINIEIVKDQALSNWFAEELDPDQVRYAVKDVEYLPALLYTLYGRMLVDSSLKHFKAACDYLPTKCYYEIVGITDVYGR